FVGRPLLCEWAAQPRLERCSSGLRARAPDAPRGDLHERKQIAHRHHERVPIALGPALLQDGPELGTGARALVDERATHLEKLPDVDSNELPAERCAGLERA